MAAGQREAAKVSRVSKHRELDDGMQATSSGTHNTHKQRHTPAAGVSTPRSVNSSVMYL